MAPTENGLMEPTQSCFLLIDVQTRLLAVMPAAETVVRNCAILLEAAGMLDIPRLATEQYPRGLGPTDDRLRSLIGPDAIIEKQTFSAQRQPGFDPRLAGLQRSQVIVAGLETHVCVLQSSFDLLRAGYQVFVVADASGSRAKTSETAALERLAQAGAGIVTTEMVVFEWLQTAQNPSFRQVSALIK